VKRKEYISRGEKQSDFVVGFFVMAVLIVLGPVISGASVGSNNAGPLSWIGLVAVLGFLIGTGIYRPWMALGGLGCIGTLISLGLLAALFIAVTCGSMFR
jgi:hypothetical protein